MLHIIHFINPKTKPIADRWMQVYCRWWKQVYVDERKPGWRSENIEMISGWEWVNGPKTNSRALTHRLRTPTCEGTWQHIQMSEGMRCPHLNFLSKISPKGKFNQNTSITAISARLAELVGCLMTATSDVAPSIGTLLLSDFQWGTLIWYLLLTISDVVPSIGTLISF